MGGRDRFEERLDELREEAGRTGRVEGTGVRAGGGPLPSPGAAGGPPPRHRGVRSDRRDNASRVPGAAGAPGYYGRPVLKPPVWTWEVPVYLFVGGLSGMAGALALGAGLAAGLATSDGLLAGTGVAAALARTALWIAAGGALVSTGLLVADLGRPARFLNMLRVFKWRSPMSVGAWTLAAFGAAAGAAALLAAFGASLAGAGLPAGLLGALLLASVAATGLLGAVLATYTGVLLGATAIPAWHLHRGLLPVHFGIAGLGSAAALLELLGFRIEPLYWLGLLAAGVETAVGAATELRRHGPGDRALREGRAGLLLRTSAVLAGPLALGLRLLGWIPAAALSFLLGSFLNRFGWLAAGRASGRDPEAVLG